MNNLEHEPQPSDGQFREVLDVFARGILAANLKNPPTMLHDNGIATEVLFRDVVGSQFLQLQCLNSQLRRDGVTMIRLDTTLDESLSTPSRSFIFMYDNTCVELKKGSRATEHRQLGAVEQEVLVQYIISVSYQDYSF